MKKAIVIIAVVFIFLVLIGSVVLHFSGAMQQAKTTQQSLWEAPVVGGPPETLKAIDLTGDGEDEVFVQTPAQVAIFSPEGEPLLSLDVVQAKSTMGDFNGDGADEFAVAEPEGNGLKVTVYTVSGEKLWEKVVPDVGWPTRGLSIDWTGGGQRNVLFGTDSGVLLNFDGQTGELLWQYSFPPGDPENIYVRGTDDLLRAGQMHLAAANYDGHVVLLDETGAPVWEMRFPESLRRLRAADMDGDGSGEMLLGGLNGQVWLVSVDDGTPLWQDSIGSRVNEARFLELDGDPTRAELVVGGKNGGVSVYSLSGEPLWRKSVSGKVLELATLDYDQDGQNELLVAADNVSLLSGPTGDLLATFRAAPTTLDTGDFAKEGTYLAGTEQGVSAFKVSETTSPWWTGPIPIGVVLAVVILVVAVVLTRIKWEQDVTYRVHEMSLETLRAKKKMLRQLLEDAERMRQDGQITPDDFWERTRTTREELAVIEELMLQLKPDYQPETMKCPHCGAPLDIGLDRCAYCDHVLL